MAMEIVFESDPLEGSCQSCDCTPTLHITVGGSTIRLCLECLNKIAHKGNLLWPRGTFTQKRRH